MSVCLSLALSAGAFVCFLNFFCCFQGGGLCVCEHRCIHSLLSSDACSVIHGHGLHPVAVPPCHVSGIYKFQQWKTDHRASRCHISILPRASKDSLQHALLIPMLLQTKLSAAFRWLFSCVLVGVRRQEWWVWWCLWSSLNLQRCSFVRFEFVFPLCRFEWHCPLRTVLAFPVVRCVPPQVGFRLFVCIFVRSSQCAMMSESVCLCGFTGIFTLRERLDLLHIKRGEQEKKMHFNVWDVFLRSLKMSVINGPFSLSLFFSCLDIK